MLGGSDNEPPVLIKEEPGKARALFSHECLRNNAFFKGRDPKFLDKVIDAASVEVYCEGEVIVKEGDFGDSMYFLHRGSVEILVGVEMERVAVLSDGNIFGEMSILGKEHKRSSTVRALEFCDCRVVHHRPFMSLLKRFPDEQVFFKEMAQERSKELKQVETDHKKKAELERPLPGHHMRRLSRRISAAMAVSSFSGRRHSSAAPASLAQSLSPSPASPPTRTVSPRPFSNNHQPVHLSSVGELAESNPQATWNTKLASVRSKLQAIAAFAKMGMSGGLGGPSPAPGSGLVSRQDTSPQPLDSAAVSRRTSVAAIVGTLLGSRRKSAAVASRVASRRQSNVKFGALSAASSRRSSQFIAQPPLAGHKKVVGLAQPQVDVQEIGSETTASTNVSEAKRRMSLHHGFRAGADSDSEKDPLPMKKRSQSICHSSFKSLLPDPHQQDGSRLVFRGCDDSSTVLSMSIPSDDSGLSSFVPTAADIHARFSTIIEGTTPRCSTMDEPRQSAIASAMHVPPDVLASQPNSLTNSEDNSARNSKEILNAEELGMKLSSSLIEAASEEQLAALNELASKIQHTEGSDSDSDISDVDMVPHQRGNARGSTLQLPDFTAIQPIHGFGDPMFEGSLAPIRSTSPLMFQQLAPQQKAPQARISRRKPLHSIQLGTQAGTGRKLASRYDCNMWVPRRGVKVNFGESFPAPRSKVAPYPAPELPPMLGRPLPAVSSHTQNYGALNTEPWLLMGQSESQQTFGSEIQQALQSPQLDMPMVPRRYAMYGARKRMAKTPSTASSSRTASTTRLGRCDSSGWFRGPQARSQASSLESLPRARTAGSVGIGRLFTDDSQEELHRCVRSAGTIGIGPLFTSADIAEEQSGSLEAQHCERGDDDDGWRFIPTRMSSDGSNYPMLPLPLQDGASQLRQPSRGGAVAFPGAERSLHLGSEELLEASSFSNSVGQVSLGLIESAVHGLPAAG